jgi:hypothetical protein
MDDNTNIHNQQTHPHTNSSPDCNHMNTQSTSNTESPNVYNSSPYSSEFHTQDMIALSPIHNSSPQDNNNNNNSNQSMIDLTTPSPHQNDSAITPRNLSSSFPTSEQNAEENTPLDLGNHPPGNHT